MDLKTLYETPPWEWPQNAGKAFHQALVDRRLDTADRLIAAELAGDSVVINDELAECLIGIVRNRDEPELLRGRAAIALGPALELADMDGFDDPDDSPITERTFRKIQDSLRALYFDESIPKLVRRRILEASVRASQDWHRNAVEAAYATGDRDWMLTAVFAMRWVRGFDTRILEALKGSDPDIHYEAVEAAGNWELDAAWSHITALVRNPSTPKRLLLAAIAAAGSIRPAEARAILEPLASSDDEEIAEAAQEAIDMAESMSSDDENEDDDQTH